MRRIPRLAWVAGFLGVVMIAFAASFVAIRAADGGGDAVQAAHTADAAQDCARSCGGDDAHEAAQRAASTDGHPQCPYGKAATGMGGSCPALKANSFASASGAADAHGSCSSDEAASFASAGESGCSASHGATMAGGVCGPSDEVAIVANGALTGHFLNRLSSACQSACGTDQIDMTSVAAQPGAHPGEVTQCPVSGAVFTVRENHPGWSHAGTVYYTCCETCAGILAKNPERFLEI